MDKRFLFRGKTEYEWWWWHYGVLIQSNGDVGINPIDKRTNHTEKVVPDTVSQCTGLKDIKGIDVYEGDILLVSSSYDIMGLVIWDSDSASFSLVYQGSKHTINKDFIRNCKVIGNRYDDPNLVEKMTEATKKEQLNLTEYHENLESPGNLQS